MITYFVFFIVRLFGKTRAVYCNSNAHACRRCAKCLSFFTTGKPKTIRKMAIFSASSYTTWAGGTNVVVSGFETVVSKSPCIRWDSSLPRGRPRQQARVRRIAVSQNVYGESVFLFWHRPTIRVFVMHYTPICQLYVCVYIYINICIYVYG